MGQRTAIREILQKRNIELHIIHDDTKLEDVTDKLAPLFKVGSMVAPFVGIVRDTYARMGTKSTAQKSQTFTNVSYEKVVAATALAINKDRMDLQQMLDVEKGAYFEIALGATATSYEGQIVITVEDGAGAIQVNGTSEIPGQKYAWGRGTTALDNVFDDIAHYLIILPD